MFTITIFMWAACGVVGTCAIFAEVWLLWNSLHIACISYDIYFSMIFWRCNSKNTAIISIFKFAQIMRTNQCNRWFPCEPIASFGRNMFLPDFENKIDYLLTDDIEGRLIYVGKPISYNQTDHSFSTALAPLICCTILFLNGPNQHTTYSVNMS